MLFSSLQLQPLGCNLINVPSDQHGLIPMALKDILSRWRPSDLHKPGNDVPKVLYTIPNGGNPTGASMTRERKRDVYEVGFLPIRCSVWSGRSWKNPMVQHQKHWR